jgi:hypothetical protein
MRNDFVIGPTGVVERFAAGRLFSKPVRIARNALEGFAMIGALFRIVEPPVHSNVAHFRTGSAQPIVNEWVAIFWKIQCAAVAATACS